MQKPELKNILILQTGFIGDVILTTPVISVLKEYYPDASINLITTPVAAELFKSDKRLSKIIPFDKRKKYSGIRGFFSFLKIIRENRFDAVFSLHKSFRTSLLMLFSGIPLRYGFKESKLSSVYTKVSSRKSYKHDVLRNLAILKNIGLKVEEISRPMSLQFDSKALNKVNDLIKDLRNKNIIAVAPGSVWKTKRWTEEGFSKLITALIEDYSVILVGGKGDFEVVQKILANLGEEIKKSSFFLNLVGELNLEESAALISQSDAVITNDSAPLHMASSFQIPTVALFCATVPEFGFGPWMTDHEIVEVDGLSCRPCGRHGSNKCPTGTDYCRTRISHQMVLGALKKVLERCKKI